MYLFIEKYKKKQMIRHIERQRRRSSTISIPKKKVVGQLGITRRWTIWTYPLVSDSLLLLKPPRSGDSCQVRRILYIERLEGFLPSTLRKHQVESRWSVARTAVAKKKNENRVVNILSILHTTNRVKCVVKDITSIQNNPLFRANSTNDEPIVK